jgi:hypothetical protein
MEVGFKSTQNDKMGGNAEVYKREMVPFSNLPIAEIPRVAELVDLKWLAVATPS